MKIQNSKFKIQKYRSEVKIFISGIHFAVLIVILHFALCTLHLSEAHAQEVSLRVAPSLLQITLYPPTEINAPITIENMSNEAVVVTPELRLFKASSQANGRTEFVTGSDENAELLRNIMLEDGGEAITSLTLGAKQKRDLRLRIQIPAETPSQDLYFSVVFISQPSAVDSNRPDTDQTSFTLLNAGIAMNVILSIGGSQPNAAVEEFSTSGFIQKGPVPFTVKLQNKGTKYIKPKGNITIKNMFGQTIGKVDLDSETILADSSRYLGSPGNVQSRPEAIWSEKFLLGFYQAKLTVQPTPDAIPLTQTVRFTALPVRLAVGFVLAILLGVTIYHRVKARMLS